MLTIGAINIGVIGNQNVAQSLGDPYFYVFISESAF